MNLATKDSILNAKDWNHTDVDVPHWGRVRIRELSAAEYTDFARDFSSGNTKDVDALKLFGRLVVACVVDDAGEQVFTAEDLDAVQRKSLKTLQYVAEQILKFNGIGGDEELEKN